MEEEPIYEIRIGYDPETDDLSSSLGFLSKVINGQAQADRILASCFQEEVSTSIILHDISQSSIKLALKNTVQNTEDVEIKEKGWKAFFNRFLIEARKPYLEYASQNETLEAREDIQYLREETAKIAEKNHINSLPYESLSDEKVAECLASFSTPTGLGEKQAYKAKIIDQEYEPKKNFNVSSEQIQEVLDDKQHKFTDQIVYLKPKTAVYQGESQWEFYESKTGKVVKGKILDETWLKNFQEKRLPTSEYPYPGTILQALADIEIQLDKNNFNKSETYFIKRIYGPVSPDHVSRDFIQDETGQ